MGGCCKCVSPIRTAPGKRTPNTLACLYAAIPSKPLISPAARTTASCPKAFWKTGTADTLEVQKNKEGLDLNRNFPANWRQEGEQTGAGPFPGSEPEVGNLIKFIAAHPNITGAITFHTFSGVLLRPYGTQGGRGHARRRFMDVPGHRQTRHRHDGLSRRQRVPRFPLPSQRSDYGRLR